MAPTPRPTSTLRRQAGSDRRATADASHCMARAHSPAIAATRRFLINALRVLHLSSVYWCYKYRTAERNGGRTNKNVATAERARD